MCTYMAASDVLLCYVHSSNAVLSTQVGICCHFQRSMPFCRIFVERRLTQPTLTRDLQDHNVGPGSTVMVAKKTNLS